MAEPTDPKKEKWEQIKLKVKGKYEEAKEKYQEYKEEHKKQEEIQLMPASQNRNTPRLPVNFICTGCSSPISEELKKILEKGRTIVCEYCGKSISLSDF
jgi:DNA-directed RNA polymerase subunit RPC12/RpoP